MNTTAAPATTDDELLAAMVATPGFDTVQDSAHLAYLLDMDQDEIPAAESDPMADDIAAVREIILNRIAKRAPFGGLFASVAQVWNWWEIDNMGPVPVERAIRSLIADGTVDEDRHYGALAFRTIR
jgi:hypothetical protein